MAGMPLTDPYFANATPSEPILVSWDGLLADPDASYKDHEVYGPQKIRPISRSPIDVVELYSDVSATMEAGKVRVYVNPSTSQTRQVLGQFWGNVAFKEVLPGQAMGVTRLASGHLFVLFTHSN
ncbi:MAG: hypothetical protein KatS3mg109_0043 [Pirellulaceae bacterium]|nr:MAG: hypothetical protein KatS3mg109_0043 [Pirellulaceae bacterium]